MARSVEPVGPCLLLMDETALPGSWVALEAVVDRLRREGHEVRILSVPCPRQPFHPRPVPSAAYEAWVAGPLPPHGSLWATSLSTALLAASASGRGARWLMARDPLAEFAPGDPGRELTRHVLRQMVARPVATDAGLARWLGRREGLDVDVLPALPAPLPRRRQTVGTSRRRIVVDHGSADADGLAAAAAALMGLDAECVLLTDLLDPPWAAMFSDIRLRPMDRPAWYATATAVLKLDGFHASRAGLTTVLQSGTALIAGAETLAGVSAVHGRNVWRLADSRPDRIRSDVGLLLDRPDALAAIAERARADAEAWRDEARQAPVSLGAPARPDPAGLRSLAERVLSDPACRSWNGTILRRLTEFYESGVVA